MDKLHVVRRHRYLMFILLLWFVLRSAGCTSGEPEISTYQIGVITLAPQLEPVLDGFKAGLEEAGYQAAQFNYVYDSPAPEISVLDQQAETLVEAGVDLILALGTPATQAAFRATEGTAIPVVFAPVTDPVAAGVVSSLSQPGGNLTGVTLGTESEGQRLQWLLRVAPDVQRIYLPYNPDDASAQASVQAVTAAATVLGVELIIHPTSTDEAITAAIDGIPEEAQAIFLAQDNKVAAYVPDFAAAAIARQLPLCVPTDGQVEQGALVSYSFRLFEIGQQTSRLADQILKGAIPANLPVETAEFFLTLNLQTAEALHLSIPNDILRTADRVIR